MSKPTGLTYKFSTFQELVERVPADRIVDCMEELAVVFEQSKISAEVIRNIVDGLSELNGETKQTPLSEIIELPKEFSWVDDGKGKLEIVIHSGDNVPLASLCTKLKENQQ